MEPLTEQILDLAKGAVVGAFIGDAAGAHVENSGALSKEAVNFAFSLPGGGTHKIGKGQITDDSEMAMCLIRGLSAGKGTLDLNQIAIYFGKWFESKPFDVGNTVRNSVPRAVGMKEH